MPEVCSIVENIQCQRCY